MRFFLLLMMVVLTGHAYAQSPIPSNHPVQDVERTAQEKKQRDEELKKEMSQIKSDLRSKKDQLVKVADNIKKNELKLLNLEKNIDEKKQEQLNIEVSLEKDRIALSNLILALQRIERIPPEALIVRPGAPLQTAQSAMLLQNILPTLNKKAEELNASFAKLNQVVATLEQDRKEVLEASKTLQSSQGRLNNLLKERELIYSKTEKDAAKNKQELARISKEAKNLRDLVKRIEQKQKKEDMLAKQRKKEQQKQQRDKSNTAPSSNIQQATIKTPIPTSGAAQLPIAGIIKTSYGKTDDIGAVSKGVSIQGRSGSLVVAPMGGVIDYAGKFKGYGNIVIIRHEKEYHSLVAGLSKIDTVVGRAVSAGEPIGKMGTSNDGTSLYYELRYKGQPINPSKKISGLK